ncbi:MAG TPA: site-2 protease family protein [Candidatus Lokiarchaeia archaeon]|nr:site-2 protease family protein [Candidatus Lokiarchaeia archaeon]
MLTKIGQRWPRFWKAFWTVGIFVSFAFMIYGFWFFTTNLISLIVNPKIENAVTPIIPGVTIDFSVFVYLILPILFVITVHEFGHGVAATAEKIEVKSSGVFAVGAFFIIGFGAFVEPDDSAFRSRQYSRATKMRVHAAGTFMNAIEFGIAFLLLTNFAVLISPWYNPHVFSIQSVTSTAGGGFNADNLVTGEVCIAINGTKINLDSGPTLNDILINKTDLKCGPGSTLNLSLYQPSTKTYVNRIAYLGPRNYVGFTTTEENNSAARIDTVYTVEQGGNNNGTVQANWIITRFNGIPLDYANNQTVEHLVGLVQAGTKVNITVDGQGEVEINVNYQPTVSGAYLFQTCYLGFTYSYLTDTSVKIETVFSNATEGGVNEGHISPGDVITAVNGQSIDRISNSLEKIIDVEIRPSSGQILDFSTSDGRSLKLVAVPIPVITVFIGLQQADYWMPTNAFSELLGATFPAWMDEEIYWFLLLAFSLTIFNMMPIPIFDGNHLVSEVIDWSVDKARGAKYIPRKRAGVRMKYYEKTAEYRFPEAEVLDVERVVNESDPSFIFENGKDFKLLEAGDSGTYDGLSFDIEGGKKPVDQDILLVDYEYVHDENKPIKKRILWVLWAISLFIIVSNFIVSYVKFGNLLFWT